MGQGHGLNPPPKVGLVPYLIYLFYFFEKHTHTREREIDFNIKVHLPYLSLKLRYLIYVLKYLYVFNLQTLNGTLPSNIKIDDVFWCCIIDFKFLCLKLIIIYNLFR